MNFKFALTEKAKQLISEQDHYKLEDFTPKQSTELSVGYDVRCIDIESASIDAINKFPEYYLDRRVWCIKANSAVYLNTGLKVFIPKNWWLAASGRSGMFIKDCVIVKEGKIDEDYEGELKILARYIPDSYNSMSYLPIKFGDKVAQIFPQVRYEMIVEMTSESELQKLYQQRGAKRGEGGYGSTGK